ncbi:unnamed protein product [Closterium sp. NIES-53]
MHRQPSPSVGVWASLRRPVYGLRQAPREWHDTQRTALAALGFAPATADPSLFLRTDTSLPPFYVLVYVDDLVFATADTEAMTLVKSELSFSASVSSSPRHSPLLCLSATRSKLHLRTSPMLGMGLVLGGRGPIVLTGHADASWVDDSATQQSSQGYTFSLGSGSVSWRSTRWSLVLSSSCEGEIYAGAMAAQELRWLTYLLTDLGEQPRSPSFLYQRGQLRLAYVATRANTADIFTKALPRGEYQRFSTVLGLLALPFLTGLVTTCSPPLCLWGTVEARATTGPPVGSASETRTGAASEGVGSGGTDSGGAASPSGGGAVGDPAGGPGAGQPLQPDLLETLLPLAIQPPFQDSKARQNCASTSSLLPTDNGCVRVSCPPVLPAHVPQVRHMPRWVQYAQSPPDCPHHLLDARAAEEAMFYSFEIPTMWARRVAT